MSTVYQDIIIDHYRFPRNFGTLEKPTKTISVSNPLCGDSLTMEIIISNQKIRRIAFRGEGCAISLASASLLTEYSKGKPIKEVRRFTKETVFQLLNIPLSPSRIKCALLSLEALYWLVK